MYGQKCHLAKDCKSGSDREQSNARGSGLNKANRPRVERQLCFKCGQPEHFAKECTQGRTGSFSCCAITSFKQDDLIVNTGCTDHVVRNNLIFSS